MNRLYVQLRSFMFRSGEKRANWLRKKNIFGHIGQQVMIQDWHIPYDPKLVFIGDNVRLASNVSFITHDVAHHMLNNMVHANGEIGNPYSEKVGEIHIGDNVFIGAGTSIMYDVSIGSQVIVGAGSVVTKNLQCDSVCAGVPCKRIGDFEHFCAKRRKAE